MSANRAATQQIEPHLIEIPRDVHAHPELGFRVVRTAGMVSAELISLGIPHQTGIGKPGAVGPGFPNHSDMPAGQFGIVGGPSAPSRRDTT